MEVASPGSASVRRACIRKKAVRGNGTSNIIDATSAVWALRNNARRCHVGAFDVSAAAANHGQGWLKE